ncbi:heterogeneous nuclear ribonucleoprotein M [Ochotona princeps]|uniref:heterogeneous nuclear ribonucleoprotein M n=1 Tax=Ochotona princeps TaxID=9978 RepID=UPI002714A1DE|nr:heterogeneous nuclear ribonucleoprotein M [Ochotona princeps]
MAAGVEAAAEVAATEPKMEEESGTPGVPSGNGAPAPKSPGPGLSFPTREVVGVGRAMRAVKSRPPRAAPRAGALVVLATTDFPCAAPPPCAPGGCLERRGVLPRGKQARGEGERPAVPEKRKEKTIKRGGSRFEPYGNPSKRYRAFITNIPFDVKWQSLKDLVKEKVGEVTYVELLMDAEGKSRVSVLREFLLWIYYMTQNVTVAQEGGQSAHVPVAVLDCGQHSSGAGGGLPVVVEFKLEESMKKAAEVLNKHSLSGRPLKVKEDPDGEHARRAMQKAGRLGSTVFVANLDYKVGWKKLKEVFSMAGVVVRADILEDKDGKSRGIGTVTFEQSIEAVQAISMFNGQLLFDRPMHVKMDERALPKGDFFPPERPQQLPHGLGGIGMGLGPGGQPIDANHLNKGIGMGNLGPAGIGMEGIGFGINKMGAMEGPFGGGMENMGRFGSGVNMGRINEILSNALKRGEIIAKQGGGGGGGSVPGIERMGPGIDRIGGAGMERMGAGLGHGMDRVGSEIERMGLVMDRMGSVDRMGSGIERMGPLGLDHMASSIERMGQTMERIGSGVERMGAGMGFGLERMAAPIDRVGQTIERMGSGVERMGLSMERMVPAGMGAGLERMGPVMDRMATGLERMGTNSLERMGLERMGANSLERMGLERMGANSLERMGPALGAGIERMGLAMGGGGGASFDRAIEMERGNFGGSFAGSFGAGGHAPGVARKACQIFVRNVSRFEGLVGGERCRPRDGVLGFEGGCCPPEGEWVMRRAGLVAGDGDVGEECGSAGHSAADWVLVLDFSGELPRHFLLGCPASPLRQEHRSGPVFPQAELPGRLVSWRFGSPES